MIQTLLKGPSILNTIMLEIRCQHEFLVITNHVQTLAAPVLDTWSLGELT